MLDGKSVLITGGTGSFGQAFTQTVLQRYQPKRLIIFSRDELKQVEMQRRFPPSEHSAIRYFLGDVRDRQRLYRAFDQVDVVVHAAALKQVPLCEYNPLEAVRTNIMGASNVIDAAIDRGVEHVMALSTDKAASPINLYGATKLCSDKLFIAANSYVGEQQTRFSVVRYGNVLGSRGSVIPFFLEQRKNGVLPVTDKRMTRFWITLEQAVDFVLSTLKVMRGGEIYVPKIPSMRIVDLAEAIAPQCALKEIGIRPGEKLHEVMITEDDARNTLEQKNYYIIEPYGRPLNEAKAKALKGLLCAEGFRYSSETNSEWLSVEELRALIAKMNIDRRLASGA